MVAQFADLIVRLEGIEWALCIGRYRTDLLLSIRTNSRHLNAGKMIRQIVGSRGTAGGHDMIAGGRVDLEGRDWEEVARSLTKRILEALGRTAQSGGPIVSPSSRRISDTWISLRRPSTRNG